MKKKIIIIISFLFIIALIVVSTIFIISNKEGKRLEITTIIDKKDNYTCEINIKDEKIVKYVDKYSLNEKENFDDGKSHINFIFKGIKPGRTTVTIKCIDTKNNEVLNNETHKVMVNKKLETSIYLFEK